jgi:hypothetical protein
LRVSGAQYAPTQKMQHVYVQNQRKQALMPTRPATARHLLDAGKAIVVNLCPFTIRLWYATGENRQEIVVGLDTGAVDVGCAAVSGKKVMYASETRLRTDISRKMQRRAKYRRNKRIRKTRYRQPRFNNRTRPEGWLPPSLQSKADSTVKIVRQLAELLPITTIRVEIAKFDTQKLQNPEIEGEQYQQGVTAGYDNVRAYVFERDNHTCQVCKKPGGILQTHHIRFRKDGGSDRPDNLVTVHKACHEAYHKGLIKHTFRKPKSYKEATQVTVLKDYIVRKLRKTFEVEITFGHLTKRARQRLNLPKSHCFDAIAVCNPRKVERTQTIYKRVCVPRGRYQLTKGARSEKRLPKGKVFGFRQWDKVKIGKQTPPPSAFPAGPSRGPGTRKPLRLSPSPILSGMSRLRKAAPRLVASRSSRQLSRAGGVAGAASGPRPPPEAGQRQAVGKWCLDFLSVALQASGVLRAEDL